MACIMTQLETMQHAKQYLDQLSNGTDPITQEPLKRDDPLATERLQKCFAYVSGILGQVIANGGQILARHPSRKLPFSLSEEALAQVAISETPIPIKAFAANVNARIDPQASRPLSPVAVTNWLVEKGCRIAERTQIRAPGLKGQPGEPGKTPKTP